MRDREPGINFQRIPEFDHRFLIFGGFGVFLTSVQVSKLSGVRVCRTGREEDGSYEDQKFLVQSRIHRASSFLGNSPPRLVVGKQLRGRGGLKRAKPFLRA